MSIEHTDTDLTIQAVASPLRKRLVCCAAQRRAWRWKPSAGGTPSQLDRGSRLVVVSEWVPNR
jgi:hypothetical protein